VELLSVSRLPVPPVTVPFFTVLSSA
jgi:hypothetical protein